MSKFRSSRFLAPVVALAIAITASLACGDTTTERLQEVAEEPTSTISIAEPTAAPSEPPEEEATTAPTEEPGEEEPPPTPGAAAEALQVVKQGFGQDGRDVGYAFIIENTNAGFAFEMTRYQIAVYDDGGAVYKTWGGHIELILPSQTLGIAANAFLDEGVTVSSIEVQLLEGRPIASNPIPPFSVERSTFLGGEYTDYVTAVINNPYDLDLKNLRVSAVTYNEGGDIIGGGDAPLNFIRANSSIGVEVPVFRAGDVASVELYPMVSGLHLLSDEPEIPAGAGDIGVLKQGFGQDEAGNIEYGILIQNPNEGFAVEDSRLHITFFDEDGRVLDTVQEYVEVLLPNQTLGYASSTALLYGLNIDVARMDAQILAGKYVESEPVPFFTAENITYQPEAGGARITGQIVSPYSKDFTYIWVSAILYDREGEIIGGGSTVLDFIPADGKAAVEVSVTSSGTPATTELYATVSGLSELE